MSKTEREKGLFIGKEEGGESKINPIRGEIT